MPETTTAFTACDFVIQLDDAVGTLRDISGSNQSIDMNFDNKIGDYRVFGTEWMSRIQCGKDAAFTLKGVASTAANELRDIIENWYFSGSGPRSLRLDSPDSATGSIRYAAEVLLKTFKFSGDASKAEPVMYEIELVPNGAVTRAVI